MPIFSVQDGYISRIKISLRSYGKVLYIDHPNGYTTVYGHLQKFNDPIEKFVKRKQYKNKSFTLDISLKQNKLKIKKGQIIAFSGNTGGSNGPHLHYEVRETKTQKVINPLLTNIKIKDRENPIIKGIYLYPLSEWSTVNRIDTVLKVNLIKKMGKWVSSDTIPICGRIGFGVSTIDLFNKGRNKNGVYGIDIFIDTVLSYSYRMNKISFDEMKYINTHIDFKYWKRDRIKIQKGFIEPQNKLSIYQKTAKQRVIFTKPNQLYKVTFKIRDYNSNESLAEIYLKGIDYPYIKKQKKNTHLHIKNRNNPFRYENEDIEILFPKNAFFEDIFFEFERRDSIYKIHNKYTALQNPIILKFNISEIPFLLREKMLLMEINKDDELEPLGGYIKGDKLILKTKKMGKMILSCDTLPPVIKAINIDMDKDMASEEKIELNISDDLSGIYKITPSIDGEWVLMEYDAKTGDLFYNFKDKVLSKGKHLLKVIVTDGKNNTSVVQYPFYR